jgi:Zn-finger nucleic acid-binding protein
MKCPVCDVTLSISSREGVEIDFCPQCRGVWLDRGELDKIIDRVNASMASLPAPPPPPAPAGRTDDRSDRSDRSDRDERDRDRYRDRDRDDRDRYRERADYDKRYDKRKKRRSMLEDLFDFD